MSQMLSSVRALRKASARLIEVPAHQGRPLTEWADAAASRDGQEARRRLLHSAMPTVSGIAVRFVLEKTRRLTEWGTTGGQAAGGGRD